MRIRQAQRRPLLFGAALLAALAATWWASTLEDDAGTVPPATRQPPAPGATDGARARAAARAPARVAPVTTLAVDRARWPEAGATLMQGAMPGPAAMAPPPPPPPPAPVAMVPTLPFRFAGVVEERGQRSVVLLEGKDIHILRAGERIDTRYRVDRITPARVEFTYLPLRQRQSLDISNHDSAQ
jgi:hypothetical protein